MAEMIIVWTIKDIATVTLIALVVLGFGVALILDLWRNRKR